MLAFGGVVTALMQTIVMPLLPHLPDLTGSTPKDVSWTLTATLLTGAVCNPLLGRAGDMYGKRKVMLCSLAILVIGSLMCALTSHIGVLIAGRALQGAALAVVPLGISVMRDELPPEKVLSSVALMSSTVGIGAAIGVPMAALVTQYADWHTMFWAAAALGLIDLVLVAACVPESTHRPGGRFDLLGALGLSALLICLLLVVSQGSDWGWTSGRTLGLSTAVAVTAVLWGLYELRARSPIVDLRVSARREVLLTHVAALLIGFSFYANSLSTSQLVQEPRSTGYGLGASLLVSGLCLLPGGLTMVVLAPVSARMSKRWGPRTTIIMGTAVMTAGYAVRSFTSDQLWTVIASATVVASGTALAYSALPSLLMNSVPACDTGAATGVNTLMRTVGQAICVAVLAVVLSGITMTTADGRTAPAFDAYLLGFLIAGAAAASALVVTVCVPVRRTAPTARKTRREKRSGPLP